MPTTMTKILTAAGLISVMTVAYADGHLTQDQQRGMDARQSHMGLLGFNLGPLGAMAQDKIDYDATVAATAAANLAAVAGISQDRYWVEGTDSSVEGSRAKAEIWTDMAGFEAEQTALATATADLAAVAGDGLDALKAAFGPVGQACGSCHENYRTPRQ